MTATIPPSASSLRRVLAATTAGSYAQVITWICTAKLSDTALMWMQNAARLGMPTTRSSPADTVGDETVNVSPDSPRQTHIVKVAGSQPCRRKRRRSSIAVQLRAAHTGKTTPFTAGPPTPSGRVGRMFVHLACNVKSAPAHPTTQADRRA